VVKKGFDITKEISLMQKRRWELKAHFKMSSLQRADRKIFIAQGEWFGGLSPQPLREQRSHSNLRHANLNKS
jgi:hypothetical protein